MSRGEYKYYNVVDRDVMGYMEDRGVKKEDKNVKEDVKIKEEDDFVVKKLKDKIKDKKIILDYLKKQVELEEKKLFDLEESLEMIECDEINEE